jgi:type VI secretion system protein ImpJ
MDSNGIVWTEGMFIAPQHFQYSDKSIRRYVNELGRLDLYGDDNGVSELQINESSLKEGKLSVKSAAGILPDRTFFKLSKEIVLDIPDGTVDRVVNLSVPLALSGSTHIGSEGTHTPMYRRAMTLHDTTDSDNEPIEAEVAEIGMVLKMSHEDLSNYTSIPFCRILEKTPEGRVVLDKAYMPRAISLLANNVLLERLDEVLALGRARAKNSASRILSMHETQTEMSLMGERFELMALNKWVLRLQNLVAHPLRSPHKAYECLTGMLVEMLAISGKTTPPAVVYNYQKPTENFGAAINTLRHMLALEKHENVIELSWNEELFEKRRLLRLVLPRKLLAEQRRPFLGISAPDSAEPLKELVPLACKLAGLSSMPDLVGRGLPGMKLTALSTAPAELRPKSNGAFFSIDTTTLEWKNLVDNREVLALHVDDRIKSIEATLYFLE